MVGFNPAFDPTGQGPFDWVGEGQEKYENGRRYVMQGGQWVDYGPAEPPVIPVDNNVAPGGIPTPAQPPSGLTDEELKKALLGTGGTNMAIDPGLWETNPEAAYMQMLGIGGGRQSPYQQWQLGQFGPTYGAYQAQEHLTPGIGFQDFYGNVGGIMGARRAAPGLFQQGGQGDLEKRYAFETNVGAYLDDLLKSVFGAKYGRTAGAQMAARTPLLRGEYMGAGGGYQTEGITNTFLDYLRQRYAY